jgi:hypothetical protein
VKGGLCSPEFQKPLCMHVGLQSPEVVECSPLCHTQVTVSPAVIVVMFVPLIESTKLFPPDPTDTRCPVGVGVTVGVRVGVFVNVGVFVAVLVPLPVRVGVIEGVSVRVAVGPDGVNVNVFVTSGVFVFVNVWVLVNVGVIDGVRVRVGLGTVGVIEGVSVKVGVGVMGGGVGVGRGGEGGAKSLVRKTAIWPRVTELLGQYSSGDG